ncbi:MAG: long-chain fatty acid--CoA ligase [Solirubrobacteraceae bacterium]|nr:long-chain fatty acid--CoA ligase [Solirubrobacteraceae bacterium]
MPQPQLHQAIDHSLNAPTLGRMVLASGARTGVAIRFPRAGAWQEWTFAAFGERVRRLALGLVDLGIGPGDRVAVLAQTRPEWTLVDAAILAAGGVVVPIYHTNSPDECRHVLADSGARLVLCEDAGQLAKIAAVRDRCPDLEHVATIEPADGAETIDDLAARGAARGGAARDERQAEVSADTPATIVYTSGTTGPPKGCVLTHGNLLATMSMYERRVHLGPGHVIFMFLPLAHVLARIVQMVSLDVGATLAFWSGDTARLIDDVAAARPTHVPSVPRVFEKIHTKALAKASEGGKAKARIFAWALRTGRAMRRAERAGRVSPLLRARHRLADRLVLSNVRDLFGGRLELALTGAAPISSEVLEFFDACGVLVLEGYGLTESCAAATLNTREAFRFGTVGRALPDTEVRIADDGEVLLRGGHVFSGYWGQPEATAEAIRDGWLHTGDLGSLDADGFLRITGRKKELIITSSGKNVSPANLEAALRDSRWLSQAVVYGDRRPYLVALVTLDPDEAPALAAELGVAADVGAMAADPQVQRTIAAEIAAVNAHFARIEQVKRFEILPHDLTQERGDLTPTQKLRRNVVYERYADRFAALYEGAGVDAGSG